MKRDVRAGECSTKFNVASDDLEYSNILNLYEESDDGMGKNLSNQVTAQKLSTLIFYCVHDV